MKRPNQSADEGSVLVLLAGFAALALLLVAVVTDVSVLFLAQRSLADTADGAANRAAQAVSAAGVYDQQPDAESLPVDPVIALRAVTDYVAESGPPETHVVGVASDGRTVTVTLEGTARLPFATLIGIAPAGVDLTCQTQARSAVAP